MLGAIICTADFVATPDALREVAVALEPQCDRVLIFAPGESDAADFRALPPEAAELHAVAAALREAGDDHAAIAASDLCHPSSALIRYMVQIRGSFEIVIPERGDGGNEPLPGLYHPAIRRRAEGLIAAGERDLAALLELASVRLVTSEEVAKFGDPDDLLERAGHSSM